ncbi:M14 family zinc carboxypeptidase [Streptomyces sp. NPDC046985]|uniref:M14 family zinc carboxypeptidase n=1 Tax=Streptomyces sp. NPDC046985 TaxID=3155377 RepID=UPI0033E1070B
MTAEVTALAGEHADVCEVVTIGRSPRGEELTMLIVPGGGPMIQVVAGPHRNEPVGLAAASALARYVVTSPGAGDALGTSCRASTPTARA